MICICCRNRLLICRINFAVIYRNSVGDSFTLKDGIIHVYGQVFWTEITVDIIIISIVYHCSFQSKTYIFNISNKLLTLALKIHQKFLRWRSGGGGKGREVGAAKG